MRVVAGGRMDGGMVDERVADEAMVEMVVVGNCLEESMTADDGTMCPCVQLCHEGLIETVFLMYCCCI